MPDSPLNAALRHFEAVEANLVKAEKIMTELYSAIQNVVAFGESSKYESSYQNFDAVIAALPKIDGWKPNIILMDMDEIALSRFHAREIGEIECIISVERQINEPAKLLREYRYRFDQKRRQLVREALLEIIEAVDTNLCNLGRLLQVNEPSDVVVTDDEFERLKENVAQISMLLGSSIAEPARWSELHHHMRCGTLGDLHEIIERDWPSAKAALRKSMYGDKEPVPVEIEDLGSLVDAKPRGPVATKLKWETLTNEDFERLIFALISSEERYENPEWLMKTNAPDRGRDLSVYHVDHDPLAGTLRKRVIIQCKHWKSKSIAPSDITRLKEEIRLWEPPRVDILIIATSGRFTSDAVALVERHNLSDTALRIVMWPESHLENLLARRPAIIAEFQLR